MSVTHSDTVLCATHGKPLIYDIGTVIGIPMACDDCVREYLAERPWLRLLLRRDNSIITTDGN